MNLQPDDASSQLKRYQGFDCSGYTGTVKVAYLSKLAPGVAIKLDTQLTVLLIVKES